jgi:hypothetical protein
MALASYLSLTQQLLQNPAAPIDLYDPAVLTDYINIARVQAAGEGLCIRYRATVAATTGNAGPYAFSAFNTGVSATNGIAGVLNARQLWFVRGSGLAWIAPRSFDWFAIYNLNVAAPSSGAPTEWAQYGQGVNGTIYLSPSPNQNYTIAADTVCYPIPLVDDTTVEALPPLWQTAIPYFAAYQALLAAQTGARVQDAERMMQLYELFMQRARRFANPDVLPLQYEQAIPEVRAAQYEGGQPARGGV